MTSEIRDDRILQLLLNGDPSLDDGAARRQLERAALVISATTAASTPWGQAALLTITECATRMFRGGVYLARTFNEPVIVGCRMPVPLQRLLIDAGCHAEQGPDHAFTLHVGTEALGAHQSFRCWADGWVATVSPRPPRDTPLPGNEISGALVGALAVSEIFRSIVLGDLRAAKSTQRLSALTPSTSEASGMQIVHLPSRLWLLGLGNLGQATLWVLGLLPYTDPGAVELVLQDFDISGPENLGIQLLTKPSWLGRKKARAAADWAASRGFQTIVTERRFSGESRRCTDEPGLVLVGVDNLAARRAAAADCTGFDLVIDAGLGATPSEVFDIRVHSFPGFRSSGNAWPEPAPKEERPLGPTLRRLISDGRIDICGAMRIAGQPLGIPTTAVAAAAIALAQACRAVSEGNYCDLVDVSLTGTRRAVAHEATLQRPGSLPFVAAR